MTQFVWKSDDHVIAIDRNDDGGSTFYEAMVTTGGAWEIVDVYEMPAEDEA